MRNVDRQRVLVAVHAQRNIDTFKPRWDDYAGDGARVFHIDRAVDDADFAYLDWAPAWLRPIRSAYLHQSCEVPSFGSLLETEHRLIETYIVDNRVPAQKA